jgi:raffinose/stachyose/melibiose transport system permease protein
MAKTNVKSFDPSEKPAKNGWLLTLIFSLLSVFFVMPILVVLWNSFKVKSSINLTPFQLPNAKTFVGFENYIRGMQQINFFAAFVNTLTITVLSVIVIILCTSMCGWYIARVNSKGGNLIYFLFAFSMVIPFQMVMYTLSLVANRLGLTTPIGIVPVYLGFGAGLATFMFVGFAKSIPVEIEEAAMIDGCGACGIFFRVVLPIMKPTYITVAILETMWIWNDYLLPSLVLQSDYRTIPIAIQYLKGGYGTVDWGAMMAVLILAIIPIIVFYALCQKYIIGGVVAGAVKG